MDERIEKIINDSDTSALATSGPNGINVVPVSVFEARGGEVIVYNFFMQKTEENLASETRVAFSCWKGFVGVQLKADVVVEYAGPDFDEAVIVMKERFPERTLKSLIKLTPVEIYDIAPGVDTKKPIL